MPDHLAILRPFYLELILAGEKTIESRLTRTAKPPFGLISAGERVFLKESSGPVRAVARAGKIISCRITCSADLRRLRKEHNKRIRGDDAYWRSKAEARYCTLVFLEQVRRLAAPFRIRKNDMRGWVVLDGGQGFDWPEGTGQGYPV